MSPDDLTSAVENSEGWIQDNLRQGEHSGMGWATRETTPRGDLTGRQIRWHPGGGRHGPDPYWRVNAGHGQSGRISAGPR